MRRSHRTSRASRASPPPTDLATRGKAASTRVLAHCRSAYSSSPAHHAQNCRREDPSTSSPEMSNNAVFSRALGLCARAARHPRGAGCGGDGDGGDGGGRGVGGGDVGGGDGGGGGGAERGGGRAAAHPAPRRPFPVPSRARQPRLQGARAFSSSWSFSLNCAIVGASIASRSASVVWASNPL